MAVYFGNGLEVPQQGIQQGQNIARVLQMPGQGMTMTMVLQAEGQGVYRGRPVVVFSLLGSILSTPANSTSTEKIGDTSGFMLLDEGTGMWAYTYEQVTMKLGSPGQQITTKSAGIDEMEF
jgi:hypothetical protein